MIDVISTAAVPSSFMRPRRRTPCKPSVISVCMSASFFWINWFAASGRPNCLRSSTYWRAVCQHASAAERAPRDAVARRVQARERAAQTADIRQAVLFRHEHFVEHDLAGDRRTQTHLAMDGRRRQSFPALLENEAADRILAVFFEL